MSGQATGWALRYGPHPDDVDRTGKPYGLARARAMRSVLVTIADAANRDGEHAHPGKEAMVEGSLYSRATVTRTVADLAAEGWIEEEKGGGGRGVATTYKMLMDRRETGSRWAGSSAETGSSEDGNRLICDGKPAQIEDKPAHGPTCEALPTVCSTEKTNGKNDARGDASTFERFWPTWPPRNGKRLDRAKAETEWARMAEVDRRAAVVGAAHLAAAIAAGGAFGPPDAWRWLRDRRWVDWQEPAQVDRRGPGRSVGDANLAALAGLGSGS